MRYCYGNITILCGEKRQGDFAGIGGYGTSFCFDHLNRECLDFYLLHDECGCEGSHPQFK